MQQQRRLEIIMKPQGPVLAQYMVSRSRVSLIRGPLGSGKTFQSCQKLLKLMCEQEPNAEGVRPSRYYAIRNTYPDLLSTTAKDWLGLFSDLGKFTQGGMLPPTHTISFRLEDGTRVESEMVFVALDRPAHVKKLRGAQVTGFYLSETKELAKAVIDMADLRHGRYPTLADGGVDPTWHGMIGDYNSPDDDHWLYRLAEEEQPEGWAFFHQPGGVIRDPGGEWRPNPGAENLINLPAGYYERGMAGKSDDWISVNLGNEYGTVVDGKPIYPEYNDRIHFSEAPLKIYRGLPIIVGFDFGRTPAMVVIQVTPMGQIRVLRERVSDDMGIKQFAKVIARPLIANEFSGLKVITMGDPAGVTREGNDKTAFLYLRAAGFAAEKAWTNAFGPRREAVAGCLTRLVNGEPGLIIDPSCKVIRQGFRGGYKYRRMMVPGDERYADEPDKNTKWSHPHDALQYAVMHVERPIDEKSKRRVVRKVVRPADTSAGY
jgi:hypothetical protein